MATIDDASKRAYNQGMGANSFLSEPIFWAFVAAMSAGLVAGYFLLKQALVDAHFEIEKREREEKEKRTRGGLR